MTTLATPPRAEATARLDTPPNPIGLAVGPRPDAAVLQQLISETMWDLQKARHNKDAFAARRATRRMTALLDELATSMIGESGSTPGPAL